MQPRRIFLGWDGPALPRAAAVICDHYAGSDGLRLDRALVVVPGARSGRRLKELLLEESDRRELPLVPPRVVTSGALPELLYQPDLPLAEPALARLVWAASLRELAAAPARAGATAPLATLFARAPEEAGLRDWAALAREVERLHREVASVGLRFSDVVDCCARSPFFDDGERWAALAAVQAGYERRLESLGVVDRELARLRALEEGVATDRDLWLLAVVDMPLVIQRMIAALDAEVRALIHAPETHADGFDALGCVLTEAWSEAEIALDDDALAVVDRPEHQAGEVARALAALGGVYSAEEVVVGVPDRGVVAYIEQRLEDAGVPTHDAAGERIARTGPYRLLEAVADALDGGRFEALAALVRHPDLGAWLSGRRARGGGGPGLGHEDAWLEPLDRYFNDHLPFRIRGKGVAADGGSGPAVATLLRTVENDLLAPLRGTRRLGEWALAALELLAVVYDVRELSGDRPRDRRLIGALEALGRAAAAYRRLPQELDLSCAAAPALRLLLEHAAGESVAADPERGAVELLGWLELHLDDAPVAIVTGVNDPYLPECVSAHGFLPDGLRSQLGLIGNDRRCARDAYQLTAMINSRESVRLITGRRSAAGDPVRPSRLVLATDGETVARRIRRFYADDATTVGFPAPVVVTSAPGEVPESSPGESREPAAPGFALPPEPTIVAPEPITRLRATDFRLLLADPYAFALERVLGLETLDDAARELDGRAFGALAHRVLDRFGRSEQVHAADESVVAGAIEEILDAEFERRYGRDAHVAVRVQLEQLRARLRRFARWHAVWVADGWRVVSVECDTGEDGVAFDVDGEPIRLSARIDRIDHHPGRGEWAVFDYKTSEGGEGPDRTHRKGRGSDKSWVDLQLPLYHWLLPHLRFEDGSPVAPGADAAGARVGYIVLPRELERVGSELADWSDDDLAEAVEVARDVVRGLRAGPFVFDPEARAPYPEARMEALLGRRHLAGDDESEDDASDEAGDDGARAEVVA